MTATKRRFDIDQAVERLRQAVQPFPPAALFALAEEGFDTPFELLVACIISIRTLDEVTLPCARRLFERARTPDSMRRLAPQTLRTAIGACTFHEAKAQQIHDIARQVAEDYGDALPCDGEVLRSFRGVGPKCANLVLGIACEQACISVDTHVHRVTNRWGYVHTRAPERTMAALEARLPRRYWVEINRLLVPFGKHICTRQRPRCSTCPVLDMCQQIGVQAAR
jgi:endonuclease-3